MWVLYQNMIRVWHRMFTPATMAVVLGLLVFAHAVFRPNTLIAVAVIGVLLGLFAYYQRVRPALGTED